MSRLTLRSPAFLLSLASLSASTALPASAQTTAPAATEGAAPRPATQSRYSKDIPVVLPGEWHGNRLPDGQPDISGHWSNTVANHNNFTDPQGGAPGEPSRQAALPRDQRAPSRVTDPADGQIPYLPHARKLQQDFFANFAEPDEQRYIEPLARCAPGGVPKSFTWHGYEIKQFPGHVLIVFNSGSRIIYLNDKGTLSPDIKLWNGESRGHWEGNTLVVKVTNNNGKALFGRSGDFMSENATVEERFIFDNGGKLYNYVATFTDPTVYSRTWTATIPARRYTEEDAPDGWHYEVHPANRPGQPLLHEYQQRACIENNGPFGGGAVGVPLTGPIIRR